MSLLDGNSLLHEYRATPWRTIYATLQQLRVAQSWAAVSGLESVGHPPLDPEMRTSVVGTAELDADTIAVIGTDTPPTKSLAVAIRGFPDWDAHASAWRDHKTQWGDPLKGLHGAVEGDEGERLIRYLTNVYEHFDTRPPTVYVYFRKGEWEFKTKDGFGIEIEVPQPILDALAAAVLSGRCSTFRIALKLEPAFTDSEHAPPSVPVRFGILRMSKFDDGTSRGWIESLSWSATQLPARIGDSGSERSDASEEGDYSAAEVARSSRPVQTEASSALLAATRQSVEELARTTRNAFVGVFALIVLLAILR